MYSVNKGADQLRSNWAADLRLCFHTCKKQVFSQHGSLRPIMITNLCSIYCDFYGYENDDFQIKIVIFLFCSNKDCG